MTTAIWLSFEWYVYLQQWTNHNVQVKGSEVDLGQAVKLEHNVKKNNSYLRISIPFIPSKGLFKGARSLVNVTSLVTLERVSNLPCPQPSPSLLSFPEICTINFESLIGDLPLEPLQQQKLDSLHKWCFSHIFKHLKPICYLKNPALHTACTAHISLYRYIYYLQSNNIFF